MGRLINRPCIYDSYYPCDFGCNNTDCEFYEDEEQEFEGTEEDLRYERYEE